MSTTKRVAKEEFVVYIDSPVVFKNNRIYLEFHRDKKVTFDSKSPFYLTFPTGLFDTRKKREKPKKIGCETTKIKKMESLALGEKYPAGDSFIAISLTKGPGRPESVPITVGDAK